MFKGTSILHQPTEKNKKWRRIRFPSALEILHLHSMLLGYKLGYRGLLSVPGV